MAGAVVSPHRSPPDEPIASSQLCPRHRPLVDGELMAPGEVFEGELAVAIAQERREAKQVSSIVIMKPDFSGSEPRDRVAAIVDWTAGGRCSGPTVSRGAGAPAGISDGRCTRRAGLVGLGQTAQNERGLEQAHEDPDAVGSMAPRHVSGERGAGVRHAERRAHEHDGAAPLRTWHGVSGSQAAGGPRTR